MGFDEIDEDWEEWDPSKTPFLVHVVAGSFAGAAEHLVVFPFDTMKTFLQAEGSGGTQELRDLVREQGKKRLWRGVSTTLMGCIPAHAGYFSIYEWGKVTFGADGPHHAPLAAAFTGAFATVAHDAVMSPMDVIKQRMQLGFHSSIVDAFTKIIKNEGPAALFRSYPMTLAMNMPFAAVAVATNESLKKIVNKSGEYNLFSFIFCGFCSGGAAGLLTTPLDVIRTRLNTQTLLLEAHTIWKTAHLSSDSSTKVPYRFNANAMQSALSRKLTSGHQVNSRYVPIYAAARLKYTKPVGCPVPIALWASPGSSTLAPCKINEPASKNELTSKIRYSGPFQAAKSIYEKEGLTGFFRGGKQRMAVQAPGFAISWTAYETAKSLLLSEPTTNN